jgi:hypothetical protein
MPTSNCLNFQKQIPQRLKNRVIQLSTAVPTTGQVEMGVARLFVESTEKPTAMVPVKARMKLLPLFKLMP